MIGRYLYDAGSLLAYCSVVLYLTCVVSTLRTRRRAAAVDRHSLAAKAGRLFEKYLLLIWVSASVLIIVGDLLR